VERSAAAHEAVGYRRADSGTIWDRPGRLCCCRPFRQRV